MTEVTEAPRPVRDASPRRVRGIDGLRGMAVLAVMLFHTDSQIVPAGYLGVDIFFVISGFLIGDILFRGAGRGLKLTTFWLRRARRLAPALLVLVGFLAVMRLVYPTPGNYNPMPTLAALTYTTNWYEIARSGSYFASNGPPSLLLHTWSLAIEEQFYLIYPLVLLALMAMYRRRRHVAFGIAALALLSALWTAFLWEMGASVDRLYMGTDCRVQSLLVGACGAVVIEARVRERAIPPGLRAACVAAGGVLIAALALTRDVAAMFAGGFLVVSMATIVLIAGCLYQGTVARLMGWRPLVLVGVMSYSVYLWHFPIFAWIQGSTDRVGLGAQAWCFVLTLLVAAGSYRFIERPFLRGRFPTLPAARQWTTYAAIGALIAGTALFPAGSLGPRNELSWPAATDVPEDVLVMGDSVALGLDMYFPRDRYPDTEVTGTYQFACSFSALPYRTALGVFDVSGCQGWDERAAVYLRDRPTAAVVVESPGWVLFPRVVAGRDYPIGTQVFDEDFRTTLTKAVSLASGDGRRAVYVVKLGCMLIPGTDSSFPATDVAAANRMIEEVVSGAPDSALTVDPADLTCDAGRSTNTVDGVGLRDDGMHWTPRGGERIWNRILWAMAENREAGPSG